MSPLDCTEGLLMKDKLLGSLLKDIFDGCIFSLLKKGKEGGRGMHCFRCKHSFVCSPMLSVWQK